MGVRKGYKLTEVGEIPEDWISASLKELASKKNNAIVGGPFGSDLTAKDYTTVGIPVIRGQNMARKYVSGDSVFVSEGKAKDLYANTATNNDLVFTQRGTLGQVSIVPPGGKKTYLISQSQMKITLDEEKANSCYVYYYFLSTYGQKQITSSAIQTGVPHTNLGILKQYLIPLPVSIIEQSAIADALGDADSLIESLESLIEKKRLIKRGAMEELLTGKTRLPGFIDEWQERRLDQLAEIHSGGTPSTNYPEYWDGDIPWCTPTDITYLAGRKHISTTVRNITHQGLANSSAELIPPNSLIMTSRATIGSCAINSLPIATNQGFKNFIPYSETDVDYLYYLVSKLTAELLELCAGSTFLEIGKKQLAKLVVLVPVQKAERSAIAQVLSDMDAEIEALEAKLEKARAIKRGMMEELLTGRIRLV